MIFDLIKERRSIFPPQFIDKPISKETIEKILEAANWAPTHKKTEPWRFKVLMGEKKQELGAFLSNIYQEVDANPKQMTIKKLQFNPSHSGASPGLIKFMDEFFDLKEGEKCLGFFYMGYFDGEVIPSARTPISEKTEWLD